MSFTMHGAAICGGIAIGHALLHSHTRLEASYHLVPVHQVSAEVARFDTALSKTRAEFERVKHNIPANAPPEFEAFIDVHLMI